MPDFVESVRRSFTRKQYQNIQIRKHLLSDTADVTAYHPGLNRTITYHCGITTFRGVRKLEVQQDGFPYPAWIDDLI